MNNAWVGIDWRIDKDCQTAGRFIAICYGFAEFFALACILQRTYGVPF
jgi:hypothetical protein